MKAAIAISAILVTIATNAHAQTVIQNSNLVFGPTGSLPPANYAFTVYQNIQASDPTSVWFKYDSSSMQLINTNIDEGSDWYIVSSGAEFSRANIAAGQFPKLFSTTPWTGVPGQSLTVGILDFWLGTATGTVLFGERTVFGWVHLRPTFPGSTSLQMIENVMTYNSVGVIVGTTTALVPEPSTIVMSVCAIAWCFLGRFRRMK